MRNTHLASWVTGHENGWRSTLARIFIRQGKGEIEREKLRERKQLTDEFECKSKFVHSNNRRTK